MNPERKVEIQLWDWMKTKSNNIEEVYFNSKNEISAPVFKTKGVQKKPDLIIKSFFNNKIIYTIVEVKDNSSSKNILQADKIIDIYYKNYVEKKTLYFVNEKEIKINNFVIATQSSPVGYLFKNETLIDNWNDKESKSKFLVSYKYKIIPRWEGNRTFEFIRQLWNFFGKIRNNYDQKCNVGILIGNSEDKMQPWVMTSGYDHNKNRWKQKWNKL